MNETPTSNESRRTGVHSSRAHGRWHLPLLLAICVAALLVGEAAGGQTIRGYGGPGIGMAWSTIGKESVNFKTEDWSLSETSWRLLAGCQFLPNLGAEAGYIYLGKGRVSEQERGAYFEVEVTGFELTPVCIVPLGKGVTGFARIGFIIWSSDMSFDFVDSGSGTKDESGTGLAFGIGGKYALGRHFEARAEFNRYAIDKTDAGAGNFNVLMIGVEYAFGREFD